MNLSEKLFMIKNGISYQQKSKEGHNYKYLSGAVLLKQVNDLMEEYKVRLKFNLMDVKNEIVRGEKRDSKSGAIIATIEFMVSGNIQYTWEDLESGEKETADFYFTGMQNDPSKALGSALTYTERIFLCKFFQIETDNEDPDSFLNKVDRASGADKIKELKIRIDNGVAQIIKDKKMSPEEVRSILEQYDYPNGKRVDRYSELLEELISIAKGNKIVVDPIEQLKQEALSLLEKKIIPTKQEKALFTDQIKNAESEHDLKIIIGTLNSRADKKQPESSEPKEPEQVVDETEKVPEKSEIDDNIAQLQDKVKTQVKFLADKGIDDFNVMARRNNSIKEHLKVDKIELCTEATLLTSYSDTLKTKFEAWKEGQK